MSNLPSQSQIPTSITIYNDQNEYIFQKNSSLFSFTKSSSLLKSLDTLPSSASSSQKYQAHSILGLIDCNVYKYLIISTRISLVGSILEHKIYKVEEVAFVPTQGNTVHTGDASYVEMIVDFFNRNPIFYSETYDLTVSFKALGETSKPKKDSYVFSRTVPHFCWNYHIAKKFDFKGLNEFVFPVINGFFGTKEIKEYSETASYIVIARKDSRRSGMRFLIRGSDSNGNVANFVETEEILVLKDKNEANITNVLSFLQIRGSIPLIWKQDPNFQLNPKIVPKDSEKDNLEAFTNHMDEMMKNYQRVTIVNLIDKKKDQKKIGDCYAKICSLYNEKKTSSDKDKFSPVTYVWFDFHSECRKMKYENLSKLTNDPKMKPSITEYGYTHIKIDSNKMTTLKDQINVDDNTNDQWKNVVITQVKKQTGVFRTNCIDCLDRTNVVQSVLARLVLHQMLFDLKLSEKPSEDPFEKFKPVFESGFKNIWADHGDYISTAYSGTPALKADFVRTGKRTLMGNLTDGYLSCRRFYINNLRDGYNQDCHDYFLGVISPKKNVFKAHSMNNLIFALGTTFLLSMTLYYIGMKMTYPKTGDETTFRKIYKYIFMIGSFLLTFSLMFKTFKKKLIDFHTKH